MDKNKEIVAVIFDDDTPLFVESSLAVFIIDYGDQRSFIRIIDVLGVEKFVIKSKIKLFFELKRDKELMKSLQKEEPKPQEIEKNENLDYSLETDQD